MADIAIALNRLSAALNESEGRQREFFLTVSHELRTPLTSVKGYAEALADGVVPPEDIPAVAGVVRSEADHLDRLVADLLDLARLGAVDVAVEPVDLDLAGLGADAAAVWAGRAARAGVQLRRRGGAHPAPGAHRPGPGPADHRQPHGERAAGDGGGIPGRAADVRWPDAG